MSSYIYITGLLDFVFLYKIDCSLSNVVFSLVYQAIANVDIIGYAFSWLISSSPVLWLGKLYPLSFEGSECFLDAHVFLSVSWVGL